MILTGPHIIDASASLFKNKPYWISDTVLLFSSCGTHCSVPPNIHFLFLSSLKPDIIQANNI